MANTERITVTVNGKNTECQYGTLLSDLLSMETPCGGHGKCGKCKVIAHGALSPISQSECDSLAAHEIALGVRLACCTRVLGVCDITSYTEKEHTVALTDSSLSVSFTDARLDGYGIAVDIGTTTLAARLYSPDGRPLSEQGELNPQTLHGADVISRIEKALGGGASELASLIRKALDKLCLSLCRKADIAPNAVTSLVITGNTVMLYLLTETPVYPLSRAPFVADRLFGQTLTAFDLELTSLAPDTKIYLPPCISAFVGADTVCAIISCGLCDGDKTRLLIDAGTNGEIALWNNGALSVCSTAAGPAFEGVGISCGMRGAVGAIDKVRIVNGALSAHTIGNVTPAGICGSGIVDALACMLDLELVEDSGYLEGGSVEIAEGITLTQRDVQSVQLAKSAICSGICTLAQRSGSSLDGISQVCVAGGFGRYLNPSSAIRIGLFPPSLRGRLDAVGNAALEGAALLLLNPGMRSYADMLASCATVTELATDPLFVDLFTQNMYFDSIE